MNARMQTRNDHSGAESNDSQRFRDEATDMVVQKALDLKTVGEWLKKAVAYCGQVPGFRIPLDVELQIPIHAAAAQKAAAAVKEGRHLDSIVAVVMVNNELRNRLSAFIRNSPRMFAVKKNALNPHELYEDIQLRIRQAEIGLEEAIKNEAKPFIYFELRIAAFNALNDAISGARQEHEARIKRALELRKSLEKPSGAKEAKRRREELNDLEAKEKARQKMLLARRATSEDAEELLSAFS